MYKLKKMLRGKATKTLLQVGAMTLLLVGGLWIGKMEAKAATQTINWEDGKTVLIPEGDRLCIDFANDSSGNHVYMDDVLRYEMLNNDSAYFSNIANSLIWSASIKRVEMRSVLLSKGGTGSGVYCYSTIPAPTAEVSSEENKEREKTPAEKWRESEHNPFNYLSEIKNADGTITYSAVPTTINSNVEGVDFIVGQTMCESMENQAQSLGTEVVGIYNIKATERKKADYKVVREITSVSGKVTYIFELQDKLKKAVENQKVIQVIQYSEEGGFQVMDSVNIENGTLSLQTSYPSGIFTFVAAE